MKLLHAMSDPRELETRPIPSLLWSYALPAVISQLVASVYNIADRIILGQFVGPLAIAGLAITLPIMNIIHAFGSLVGAGSSARMSIVLGRKDVRWAEKILGNSMLLTFLFGFLFVAAGYLFMNPILHAFGASDETIAYARQYMLIVLPGMFFTTLTFNLTGLVRASGNPHKSMWIMVGGALLNILLDVVFIMQLGMGISGAAWATTISMATSSLFAIDHFMPRPLVGSRSFVRFKRHCWAPKMYIFKNILAIGISPFSMNVAASGVAAVINMQLLRYGGDLAVGTYGIINSIMLIVFLLLMGVCQGMQPIAGYNYGAGNSKRLRHVYRLTLSVSLAAGIAGMLACCLLPRLLLRCFTTDLSLIEMGVPAIRYLTIMMPLIAFTVCNSQFFQSIDKPWIAIVTSLSRQVLFLLPMMFIVPALFVRYGAPGLTGVWCSCTASDIFGALLAGILLYTQRKVFRPGYVAPPRRPRKERGPKTVAAVILTLMLSVPSIGFSSGSLADSAAARPKVGVVLGGGGAKGAAHIGVLRYLEEQGIPVDYVAGTSMGSIMGGLYALGYTSSELSSIISGIDWDVYIKGAVDRSLKSVAEKNRQDKLIVSVPFGFRRLDDAVKRPRFSSLPSSIMGGSNLTNLFNGLSVGYQDSLSFDSLPIPFACVATDMMTGDEVVLRSGRFPQAIRASMAIPGVFAPVVIDSLLLADGGMANNFPADICRAMGADIVIGVEVAADLKADLPSLRSLPQLMSQLMNIMVAKKKLANRKLCDIYIRPDVSGYHMLSFSHDAIDTLIARGYAAAVNNAQAIAELKEQLAKYGCCKQTDSLTTTALEDEQKFVSHAKAVDIFSDTIRLFEIKMDGVSLAEQQWLLRKSGLEDRLPVNGDDLERAVAFFNATGAFSSVTYTLAKHRDKSQQFKALSGIEDYDWYDLSLAFRHAEPHMVALGFRYDTEESASILLDMGLNRHRLSGLKVDLGARLSYNPRLSAAVTLAGMALFNVKLDYRFAKTDFHLDKLSEGETNIVYDEHRIRLAFTEFNLRKFAVAAGLEGDIMRYNKLLGSDTLGRRDNSCLALFSQFSYDDMDDAIFARHGNNFHLQLRLGSDTARNAFGSVALHDHRFIDVSANYSAYLTPGNGPFTIIPSVAARVVSGRGVHRFHRNVVGGFMDGRYVDQQLSFVGFKTPLLVGDAVFVLGCDLRLRVATNHYVSLIGNYMHESERLSSIFSNDSFNMYLGAALRYSYNTPIGPVSLTLHYSDFTSSFGAYLSLGYNF